MKTRFVQIGWGLEYTQAFLQISKAKAYIQSFQRGEDVDDTTKMWESIAYSAQDRMDEEIHQHIRISNKLAKEELYEYLIAWIEYFEISLANPKRLEAEINEYNQKRIAEYEAIVNEAEKKFRESSLYKRLNHLDYYEVPNSLSLVGGYFHQKSGRSNLTRLVQYRKFFEAPDPDLIDIEYLPQYLELIRPIISRCIVIAHKRLTYLKGENELAELPTSVSTPLKILHSPMTPHVINVNMSLEQLTMLFRLLKDCKLIEVKRRHEKDIHLFISEHFETTGLEGKKSSPKNIGRLWSSKDPDVLNYWIARFKEMSEKAERK